MDAWTCWCCAAPGRKCPQRKSLLRNNCDGTFTDVTSESGLPKPATNTPDARCGRTSTTTGLLDLFVVNERGPSQLFLNKGDGTFQDISHSAGIDRSAFSKGVAGSGLRWRRLCGFLRIQHQTSTPIFCITTITTARSPKWPSRPACRGPAESFATWFFDYDNDGWPDLFVASLLHVDRRKHEDLPGAAAQRRNVEAIQEPGQRHISAM